MEFPNLGQHCSLRLCSKLDFLPIVCDACKSVFCDEHFSYQAHDCPKAYTKNVTVPICPLCDHPIPIKRGEDPNIKVNEHISRDCEIPKKKKMYDKRCSFAGCKKKELVAMTCDRCHHNYCIQHRLEVDHNCEGPRPKYNSVFGNTPQKGAAPQTRKATPKGATSSSRQPQSSYLTQTGAELNRLRQARMRAMQGSQPPQQGASPAQPQGSAVQPQGATMSEDEALAMAIAQSMQDQPPPPAGRKQDHPTGDPTAGAGGGGGYDEDAALAQAIAQSLQEQEKTRSSRNSQQRNNRTSRTSQSESACIIS